MNFKKAVKRNAKLRAALVGPAGSGKTYTLLEICKWLGGRTALIDTEHGSASKYADIFDFDADSPDSYDPKELIKAVNQAAAEGYSNLCVDSLSHYWMGKGGELEMVDDAARRNKGNSFAGWKDVTPIHNELVDTILRAPINILVSLRTKTEWVIEENERGKKTPRKIGMAPVMRDGIEYEFDICGDLDIDNVLTVTKSRCPPLKNKVIQNPGKDLAETLKAWLTGTAPSLITAEQQEHVLSILKASGRLKADALAMLNKFGFNCRADITVDKYEEVCGLLKGEECAD